MNMLRKRFTTITISGLLISAIIVVGGVVQAEELSVEVVDWEGHEAQLLNARIFVLTPTSCDSCPPEVVTLDGIRVRDNEQAYIIPWDVIERIEKQEADTSIMMVILTDETVMTVELDEDLEQSLSGDRNSDEYYVIPMRKVHLLHVMRK